MDFLDLKHYHRMSAQTPGVRELPAPINAGEKIIMPKPGASRRFPTWRSFMPPDVLKDARHVAFRRYHTDSLVTPDDATATSWLEEASACVKVVEDLATARDQHDAAYAASELDAWKKLTIQVGRDIAYYVNPTHPGLVPDVTNDLFSEVLDHIIAIYRYAAGTRDRWLPSAPDPSDTNGGYPLFTSGPLPKLASACLNSGTWDATQDIAARWADKYGVASQTALANGASTRQGPVYKWTPEWQLTPQGEWIAYQEYRGHQSRARIVQMAPYAVNMQLRDMFDGLHTARQRIRGLWRSTNDDAMLHAWSDHHYEADISAYDTSVSVYIQKALRDALIRKWPELAAPAQIWFMSEQRPLITPSWTRDAYRVAIVPSLGGTSSGLKTTAEVGTILSLALCLYAFAQQGIEWRKWPNIPGVRTSHQGDDVRISSDLALDVDAWAASFAELGFKCDLKRGYVFLSRHLMPTGEMIPLAGRIVQQTMSHEHEKRGPDALGLLYLGMRSRLDGFRAARPIWRDLAWRVVRHAYWIRTTGSKTLDDLERFLHSTAAEREIARAVAAAANDKWLTVLARDAAHSQTDAEALRILQNLGIHWESTLASEAATLQRVTRWMVAQSATARWEHVQTITNMYSQGRSSEATLLWAKYIQMAT